MRRLLTLLTAAGLALATGCGATAQPDAARVGDRAVPVVSVDALARDAAFVRSALGAAGAPGESTVPGDVARNTLLFELERTARLNEVDRWGLRLTDADRQTGAAQLAQQLAGLAPTDGGSARTDFAPSTRRALVEFFAAGSVLDRRLSTVSPTKAADLDLLYEGAPALWDRLCMSVVQVSGASRRTERTAARLVRRGVPLREWARTDAALRLAADARTGCVRRAQLPRELRDSVEGAPARRVVGPVVVRTDQGSATYWYRIERRTTVSRRAAAKDLAELAAGVAQRGSAGWVTLVLLSDVWVNPRYGSGVEVGGTGGLQIAPPESPAPALLPRVPAGPATPPAGAPAAAAPTAG